MYGSRNIHASQPLNQHSLYVSKATRLFFGQSEWARLKHARNNVISVHHDITSTHPQRMVTLQAKSFHHISHAELFGWSRQEGWQDGWHKGQTLRRREGRNVFNLPTLKATQSTSYVQINRERVKYPGYTWPQPI